MTHCSVSLFYYSADLDTETFIYFHDAWKEAEAEAKEISPKIYDQFLDNSESVLKLSSLIRSDFGTGRLVLTDKRYKQVCDTIKGK